MHTANTSAEPWALTATELAQRIRQRDLSCHEAMQSCLARLEAVNPRINAVVDCRPEEALAEADAADAALARGDAVGPLHGVPVTTKINTDQQGWATTGGVVAMRGHIAAEDAPPIANLRRAGACVLGRTNTPAFSLRWFTDNDLHGRTLNPRNAQLTPGGSSGGAGAAVACGLGAIAHGNDQGGSVRYPAYACGVYGLRTSFQRTPYYQPSAPVWPFMLEMLAVNGPLARSVADLRLGLQALSLRDARDPWQVPMPLTLEASKPTRVALCRKLPGFVPDTQVDAALVQAGEWLQEAGYIVEEAEPPHFDDCVALWFDFTVADIEMDFGEAMQRDGDAGSRNAWAIMRQRAPGQPPDVPAYRRMLARRTTLRRAWSLFQQQYPLLLMPVSWRTPFAWNADRVSPHEGNALLDAQSPLLATAAMGLPALAAPMPAPFHTPCGVQIVARPWCEDLCLAAAEVLEQHTGPVPAIDPTLQ